MRKKSTPTVRVWGNGKYFMSGIGYGARAIYIGTHKSKKDAREEAQDTLEDILALDEYDFVIITKYVKEMRQAAKEIRAITEKAKRTKVVKMTEKEWNDKSLAVRKRIMEAYS